MKCLLCDFSSNDEQKVKKHYIYYHRINQKNHFYMNLLDVKNALFCMGCCGCGDFLVSKKDRVSHNFLKHYEEGDEKPAEEKPVKVIKTPELTIYQISYNEHKDEYDFYDAEKLVDELVFNVKNLFNPSTEVAFKADFVIENKQDAPSGVLNTADIKTLLYWTTNVYRSVYFNSFVAAGIRQDILKRVISNRLSGSSWYFNRFSHLNFKVLNKKLYSRLH